MKTLSDMVVKKLMDTTPANAIGGKRGFKDTLKRVAAPIIAAEPGDSEFPPMSLAEARSYCARVMKDMPAVVPDYFEIRPDEKLILFYEVEDTHRLSMQKLSKLYDVCGYIEDDLLEFEFYVVCLDRYGNELSRLGYYELEEYYLAHVASTRPLATHPNPCKSAGWVEI